MMFNTTGKTPSPLMRAMTMILVFTALILACFAPAISMQKDQYSYGRSHSQQPAIISYLA